MGLGVINKVVPIKNNLIAGYRFKNEINGYTPDYVGNYDMKLINGAAINNGLILNGGNQHGIINGINFNLNNHLEFEFDVTLTSYDGYDWVMGVYYNTDNRKGIIAKDDTFVFYIKNQNKSITVSVGTIELNHSYKIKYGIDANNIAYIDVDGVVASAYVNSGFENLDIGYIVLGNYKVNGGSNYNINGKFNYLKIRKI